MITEVIITISINGVKKPAQLNCDRKEISITLLIGNDLNKKYTDTNFFRCFGQVRADNSHIIFMCKGSKINVHPSSMSSQMTLGLKAYELTIGKKPSLDDVIYIFDYADDNLTNDPNKQINFYKEWIESDKE